MKKFFIVSLLLIVCGTFVFANGGQQASGAGASANVLYWVTSDDANVTRRMVEAYNATNPAQKIELVLVPGAETEISKLMTAVRSGTGPDIYGLDRFTIGERAAQGLLEDITEPLKKIDPNLSSKYLDFAWAETQYNGKTYGLPTLTDTRVLFYRKDILRQKGVDYSRLDPKNGPITIAELKTITDKLNETDAQGNYTRIGYIPYATENQGWHYILGFSFGGKFADLQAKKVTPLDPGVVAAYQYFYDTAKELGPQKVRTFLSTYAPPNNPPQQNYFFTGHSPITVQGDWFIQDIIRWAPDIEWDYTYLPILKKGDKITTFAGGGSMVVPKGAKNVEGAIKAMTWWTGETGQRLECELGLKARLPTWRSLINDDSLYIPEYKFAKDLLPVAQNRPVLPIHAFYWDQLTIAQNDVANNLKTPQEALKQVETLSQAQYDRFK
ncbi:sugar ABC transporter substrate-binding protein [Spirochaetia bacterium]|nr:sugar ABC transporter substrate-binding protein [Spirochaetia bacterium]